MTKIKEVIPVRKIGDTMLWGYKIILESDYVIQYHWDGENARPMYNHLHEISGVSPAEEFQPERDLLGKEWRPFAGIGEPESEEFGTVLDGDVALSTPAESRHIWPGEIRKQVLGGNSTFTIVFGESVGRYTFKVKSNKKDRDSNWSTGNQDKSLYWVSVKIGPGDGYDDYLTIGRLVKNIDGEYKFLPAHDKRNGKMHFAAVMFRSFWIPLENGCRLFPGWEFYHATTCCVCGRKLTVPESIVSGIGPECAGKE
jgi:hypothetical protein